MSLLIAAIISGLSLGLALGLLSLPVVLIYKSSGVVNFAQGSIATVCTFFVYKLIGAGLPLVAAIVVGVPIAAMAGVLMYLFTVRINDRATLANLTARTLALYLLINALMNQFFATGQPFPFKSLFPTKRLVSGSSTLTVATVGTAAVSVVIAIAFWYIFQRTTLGLQVKALAEAPVIARLLGVRHRSLLAVAWLAGAVTSLVVGVLIAPTALLSSDMMDAYLVLGFTGAILGGLDSLGGAILGGLLVGITYNVCTVYIGQDVATLIIFGLLVGGLLLKPEGLLGRRVDVRL